MQNVHPSPSHGPENANWVPTIALAWLHLVLALSCAVIVFTGAIFPPVLGLVGMVFFGGVAIVCALATITRG